MPACEHALSENPGNQELRATGQWSMSVSKPTGTGSLITEVEASFSATCLPIVSDSPGYWKSKKRLCGAALFVPWPKYLAFECGWHLACSTKYSIIFKDDVIRRSLTRWATLYHMTDCPRGCRLPPGVSRRAAVAQWRHFLANLHYGLCSVRGEFRLRVLWGSLELECARKSVRSSN